MAPVPATSRTLRWIIAWRGRSRTDDVGVARIHDGQDLERIDVELERVDGAARVLGFADRSRADPAPGSMADRVIEGSPDDRDVHLAATQLLGSVIHGNFMNVDGPT